MTQSINEQIGTLTAIEPEFHLRKIRGKMLCADLVPASDDCTLQQRKCILDCVRVNVGSESDVFFRGVIDRFMFMPPYCFLIRGKFISHDYFIFSGNIVF